MAKLYFSITIVIIECSLKIEWVRVSVKILVKRLLIPHFKIFQNIDLSTVHKQRHEANQLKDSNLLLQEKNREKDARIQELTIENNKLKKENKVQRMDLNQINNRIEDMMNAMHFFSAISRGDKVNM